MIECKVNARQLGSFLLFVPTMCSCCTRSILVFFPPCMSSQRLSSFDPSPTSSPSEFASGRCKWNFIKAVIPLGFLFRQNRAWRNMRHACIRNVCSYSNVSRTSCTANILAQKLKFARHSISGGSALQRKGHGRCTGNRFEFLDAAAFACTAPLLEQSRFMTCVLCTHTEQSAIKQFSVRNGSRSRNAVSRFAALEAVVPSPAAAVILLCPRTPQI